MKEKCKSNSFATCELIATIASSDIPVTAPQPITPSHHVRTQARACPWNKEFTSDLLVLGDFSLRHNCNFLEQFPPAFSISGHTELNLIIRLQSRFLFSLKSSASALTRVCLVWYDPSTWQLWLSSSSGFDMQWQCFVPCFVYFFRHSRKWKLRCCIVYLK